MKSGSSHRAGEDGSASVEQAGLILLVVLALAAGLILVAGQAGSGIGRGVGVRIANRIACGPVGVGSCRTHPAIDAYGERLAKAITALGPRPTIMTDGSGRSLLPVDFRHCRRPSCAEFDPSRPDLKLTGANRRTTWFTEVSRSGEGNLVTWWGWWPGIGWRAFRRTISDRELDEHTGVRVTLGEGPRIVPLEALDGRNHRKFRGIERAPWQWTVPSNHESRTG